MTKQIRKLLREFGIDEISRTEYKDGELVVEYTDGFDYPRYMIYHETEDSSEIVAEFDSRYFDANMVQLIMEYLKTR
jgi:2-oxo-4-hydroxy-4-carboxy--5-ureidoimidazoline (OHCU) decarboxylase